ncbi:hypothetical protein D8X55_02650 [Malacoplasma penetrans]|uniref:Transmembrane protein n=1 Tax=Malacoplasma penetrans (strain HF-2) TaxID=272633 RepID=Q8EWA6_MALP2|nr:hypothetical protein [Malacoplasma penetrans]RXY96782.1 hypothetical protein D8X55_02650 [Malacoplasma penetrans]BAC44090.1 hypothetical protein [Malacoplasma penetrans HF-2]
MAKNNSKKSRSQRKNDSNKNVQAKVEKKNQFVLTEEDIEVVKTKTQNLISQLEKRSKNIFLFKKKKLIQSQIKDLQMLLEQEQFYLLDSKLKAIEEIEQKEKEEIEKTKANAKVKEPKKRKSFSEIINAIKTFDSWPLYSRTKKIIANYSDSERNKRLILMYSLVFILFAVAIIGLLLCLNVIPYAIGGDTNGIGKVVCLVFPIVCLFFV